MKKEKQIDIPTHDPYTGELNPYYEEITGKRNPLELSEDNYKKFNKMGDYISVDNTELIKTNLETTKDKDLDKMPNQKWHQIISFIKSGIRIVGYVLIPFDLLIAASVLVFSEIIGIVEELV